MEVLALHHFHLQITVTVNDTKVRAYKADSQLVSTPYAVLGLSACKNIGRLD